MFASGIVVNVSRPKQDMLLALLATAIAAVYSYGLHIVPILLLAIVGAQISEWLWQAYHGQVLKLRGGALITGILIGLILPPSAPFWSPLLAAAAGIGLAKIAVRGLFNPVVVGILLLVAVAPWIFSGFTLGLGIDAISGATQMVSGQDLMDNFFLDSIGGSIGEANGLVLILAGIWLVLRRAIDWVTPVTLFGTVFAMAWLYGEDPILMLASGGLIMAAFYIATDPATHPRQRVGRVLHALWLGVFIVMIRKYTSIPSEGVSYGILLMNILTPLLNKMTSSKKMVASKPESG